MKINTLITFLFFCTYAFGQKTYSIEPDVFESQEIIFYGYDFSHFKLAEAKRLMDEDLVKYIPAWIGFINERTNEGYLEKKFKKEDVIFNFDYTAGLIKEIDDKNLVTVTKHVIPSDSIQEIISKYQLTEEEGIGFVVVVECFEKLTRTSTAYFTFFDIATKEVIMSDYYGAKEADGYGLTTYWGLSLNETFGKYITKIYRKKLKAYEK